MDERDVFGAQQQAAIERLSIPIYASAAGQGVLVLNFNSKRSQANIMSNRITIRTRSDSLASHILPVSGTMIGVCATLIGLVKLASQRHGPSHVDEYAAIVGGDVSGQRADVLSVDPLVGPVAAERPDRAASPT